MVASHVTRGSVTVSSSVVHESDDNKENLPRVPGYEDVPRMFKEEEEEQQVEEQEEEEEEALFTSRCIYSTDL